MAPSSFAATVHESKPLMPSRVGTGVPAPTPEASNQPNNVTKLFFRLQTLEREVQGLRGLVEEQQHELKLLKKQRMDDYLDLDRRLSSSSRTKNLPVSSSTSVTNPKNTPSPATAGDERSSYKAAFALLNQQKFDQSRSALNAHLKRFPSGTYAANGHYWLGEIDLLQNKLEPARKRFTLLLKNFAEHRKAPDAKFKLAQVYYRQGNKAKAKALLNEVVASKTSASAPAKQYLKRNF